MTARLWSKGQRLQPQLRRTRLQISNESRAPLRKNIFFDPKLSDSLCTVAEPLHPIHSELPHHPSHCGRCSCSLSFQVAQHFLGSVIGLLLRKFSNGSKLSSSPPSINNGEKYPSPPRRVSYRFWFLWSLQMPRLSAGAAGTCETTMGRDNKTASRSILRNRHTRRLVPLRAYAGTLPCLTHTKRVRTLTLRYLAASAAVSQSEQETIPRDCASPHTSHFGPDSLIIPTPITHCLSNLLFVVTAQIVSTTPDASSNSLSQSRQCCRSHP